MLTPDAARSVRRSRKRHPFTRFQLGALLRVRFRSDRPAEPQRSAVHPYARETPAILRGHADAAAEIREVAYRASVQ